MSPLVSLVQDQVTKLTGLGISADHMTGDDWGRQSRIYNQVRQTPVPRRSTSRWGSYPPVRPDLTSRVMSDILHKLVMKNPKWF